MTTLQRSSVSFRRQGSSGRIWDDRHIIDPNTGLPNASASASTSAAATGDRIRNDQENLSGNITRSPDEDFSPKPKEIHRPSQRTNFKAHHKPENNVHNKVPKPKETNASPQKGQRCGISVLFGRCMAPTS